MINIKNIFKVLLVALFVCTYSGDACASGPDRDIIQLGNAMQSTVVHYMYSNEHAEAQLNRLAEKAGFTGNGNVGFFIGDFMEKVAYKKPGYNITFNADGSVRANDKESRKNMHIAAVLAGIDGAREYQKKYGGSTMSQSEADAKYGRPGQEAAAKDVANDSGNTTNDPNFCSSEQGIFTDLVSTGVKIFKQLRDLIYVVAGFGIIAVAVGGFFGNLNWKWLGAIIISLVVIATAGELVVLLTGCETFGSNLITNTLTHPTGMTTIEYNEKYTDKAASSGRISWRDDYDKNPGYVTAATPNAPAEGDGVDVE